MKKSLFAAAVLAALPVFAQAQTNVTLYGIADVGVSSYSNGSTSNIVVSPGVVSGNRWGLRGTEDLGGGMSANFNVESGFTIDNGSNATSQGGALFGRQAWAGVKAGAVEVRLGRQYSASFWTLANYDTLGLGYWGNSISWANTSTLRINNAVEVSATGGGFLGRVQLGTGDEKLVSGETKSGRYTGLGLNYAAGPFAVGFSTEQLNGSTAPFGSNKNTTLGASFKIGNAATVYAGYQNNNPYGSGNNTKALWLGANVTAGVGSVLVQFANVDPEGSAKSQVWGLAYTQPISGSKRTSAYVSFGTTRNNATSSNFIGSSTDTVAAAAAGKDPRALSVGLRHAF